MMIAFETARIMKSFGNKLEKNDKMRLNNLLNMSKRHASACSEAVRIFPMEAIFMSILLERQKTLEASSEATSGLGDSSELQVELYPKKNEDDSIDH
jgi:hypothetical protein